MCKMRRINTYVTTMKSSTKEKRPVATYGTKSSPNRYEPEFSTTTESIPLNNIANGTRKGSELLTVCGGGGRAGGIGGGGGGGEAGGGEKGPNKSGSSSRAGFTAKRPTDPMYTSEERQPLSRGAEDC